MESLASLTEYARQYHNWYWAVVWLFTIWVVIVPDKKNEKVNVIVPLLLSAVVILFITFRPPVTRYFGDTGQYMRAFYNAKYGFNPDAKDLGHEFIMQLFKNFEVQILFLFYAIVYVGGQGIVARKLFPDFTAVAMVLIVGSFSFAGYGFNGMRNGAACSLVMLAFVERRLAFQIAFSIIAVSLHKSAILPIMAYLLVRYYKNDTNLYLKIWLGCILLNALVPNILGEMSWLTDMIDDQRASYLTTDFDEFEHAVNFSHTGFRWDFLVFSAIPVYFGWQTLVKNEVRHSQYSLFLNIYLVCNSVWLFTARQPFNNRIAYLSWFLMPILLLFPFVLYPKYNSNTNMNLLILANLSLCFIL